MRAWVLGGSAVAMSAGGHVAGGGHAEPVLLLLLVAAAALAAHGWLRSERGLLAIVSAVAVAQLATHLVLAAGHAHSVSSAMTAGHVLAGLLLAVLLRHGESRLYAAARRRYLRWQIAVRTALAGVPRPPVAAGHLMSAPATLVTTWIHSPVHGRAPPVAAPC